MNIARKHTIVDALMELWPKSGSIFFCNSYAAGGAEHGGARKLDDASVATQQQQQQQQQRE